MSFITIDKLNGSSGETISTITVPEYQGLEDRTQSFKVVVDGKEVFVNVQQKAFKPSLTTNKQVVPFTQEVLTQSLQITSNFNWEARTDSSWFTLNQTEGNKGTTTIEISTSSIDSPSENRNGAIYFYFGDTFVIAITVKQEFEVIFELSTTSIDMTDETTATINVSSNVDWYCNTDITWINLDIVQGFGDKTITVTAEEFTGQDRNGFIHFYVGGELIDTIRIYQIKLRTDQFYIEPYISTFTINSDYGWLEYYDEEIEEWVGVTYGKRTFDKKTYFRKFTNYSPVDFNPLKLSGMFNIGGNIESLVGVFSENINTYNYAFCRRLFSNTQVVDASKLILPSYTFERCYEEMFSECTSLVNAPALPATTLSESCYDLMFWKCTSLTFPPELPATTLAKNCYANMFGGASLTITPILPATTLVEGCYRGMFQACNITTAPILPATTLVEGCYQMMFYDCEKLNNITILATDINAENCLYDWVGGFDGVSPTGMFTKKQSVEIPYGDSGIPNENWEVIEVP